MTVEAISPLRRRMIEDMTIRHLSPKTQQQYIRAVKNFADFFGRPLDKAVFEDIRRYQLHLAKSGIAVPSRNAAMTALRFFFRVTLRKPDVTDEIAFCREPRRLPVVLSPDEVTRLLAAVPGIKCRAALRVCASPRLSPSRSVISIARGWLFASSRARDARTAT